MMSRVSRLTIWSTFLGNLFEHYDTALFSLLSPFLAPLFFPKQDPVSALILTYGIIPLGMIVRPIGSLLFGYLGDVYGRKKALIFSLIGMSIITAGMGLLPTYDQVGVLAPILFSLGRILQNFFIAGETMGGAIYLLENTQQQKHDMMSSLYGASTIAGILLASIGVSILGSYDLILHDWWRILYFIGCFTACFGCLLRMKMHSKPFFSKKNQFNSFREIIRTCWEMRETFLTITVASGFTYATYSLALVMMNGFIPLVSDITKMQMMKLNTFLLLFDFLSLPFFGLLAHRFSRERMMIAAAVSAALSGIPLFMLLNGAKLYSVIVIRLCLVTMGVWFSATFHSWSQKLVPQPYRYTILSLAYAIGSQLFGGPTASISLWLFQRTQMISSASWYWVFLGILSTILIAKVQREDYSVSKIT